MIPEKADCEELPQLFDRVDKADIEDSFNVDAYVHVLAFAIRGVSRWYLIRGKENRFRTSVLGFRVTVQAIT